jgi:serine-type D-Ala-D-Ala carboxypeptidase (penicillin-binding protein 5/6)
MTSIRFSVRALALSLALTTMGALCLVSPASPAVAAANPIGGRQLAGRGVIVNLPRGVPAPPPMPGASWVIADMNTGQILAAKAPHARHLPASTMKTLTALTLIPILGADKKILVKPQDVSVDGSRLGIMSGTSYTAGALLQGLLMASGNDAAYALARGNKSVAVTLKAMNATAAELNASDTVAKDPSGLDAPGQSSSAYDLALIGRAAMKLPDFRNYVIKKQTSVPGGKDAKGKVRPSFKISSHNQLLFNYPGTIGIKTGYTIAAKHTLIAAASRGGKTYILTSMGSPKVSWRPSAALFNWAFAHGSAITPVGQLVAPGKATVATPARKTAAAGVQAPPTQLPLQPAIPFWAGLTGVIILLTLARARARRRMARRRR